MQLNIRDKAVALKRWAALAALLFALSGLFVSAIWFPADPIQNQPGYQEAAHPEIKSESSKTFWQKTMDDPIAFFTLWIVAFNFILSAATIKLWVSTDRLVKGAEESAIRQLRAYLIIGDVNIISIKPNERAKARFEIINTGQTPANRVIHASGVNINPYRMPANNVINGINISDETVINLSEGKFACLGQRSTITKESYLTFTADDIAEVTKGTTTRLYVHGAIIYEDIFRVSRRTNFCFMFYGPNFASAPAEQYEEGNWYT